MKALISFRFISILIGASLLAACGQTVQPTANPVVPVTGPTSAPVAVTKPTQPSASSNPKKVDACVLLPKEDVSKALGQPVQEAVSKGLGGVCSYKSNNLSIEMTVFHSGGTKYLQQARANLADSAVNITGVGDEAFYNPNSFTLLVRKGDSAYLIFLSDSSQAITDGDRQAKEKAIASLVAK